MFGKRKGTSELDPPPVARENPQASEVMRVWTAPGEGPQVTLRTTWEDPAAWGVMLVDIARHAANAYAREGIKRDDALARIRELFDAEWARPTDEAQEISRH
jgi:hypothetical protein